ncbi:MULTISPECIES: type II 3-dehydroquinate dehydratase [Synergistaceae]|jgi:3-dehydroquinate dehydratase-2|uniref:type II 3-dehydroquinate dehydratase n=1 Tax=Synergistaceae TaxID=649777 RepID=UPI003AED1981|nr:type II 3-dehydroquinate dehydratase [Synergistaceae bacterium DZ-S4]
MKILVINGPNLNMLGIREPEIYGDETLEDLMEYVRDYCKPRNVEVDFFQSNHEGDIIDTIQAALGRYDGIIINPAAYTHTSIAIPDAIRSVNLPAVEVHLSDINNREDFRKISFTASACIATVAGKGFDSYTDAVEIFLAWTAGA